MEFWHFIDGESMALYGGVSPGLGGVYGHYSPLCWILSSKMGREIPRRSQHLIE